jgi:hypothetical protein
MLYYALFYATAMPTVVYAQVVGPEDSEASQNSSDGCVETVVDLSE